MEWLYTLEPGCWISSIPGITKTVLHNHFIRWEKLFPVIKWKLGRPRNCSAHSRHRVSSVIKLPSPGEPKLDLTSDLLPCLAGIVLWEGECRWQPLLLFHSPKYPLGHLLFLLILSSPPQWIDHREVDPRPTPVHMVHVWSTRTLMALAQQLWKCKLIPTTQQGISGPAPRALNSLSHWVSWEATVSISFLGHEWGHYPQCFPATGNNFKFLQRLSLKSLYESWGHRVEPPTFP